MTSIPLPPHAVELRTTSARSAVALTGWQAVCFGLVFVAAGCGIVAIGLFASAARMHAPREIIEIVGLIFAIAGASVSVNGALDIRRKRAAAQRAAAMPGEPWWWDYPWRPDGVGSDTSRQVAQTFGMALFFVLFLTPFHWVGIAQRVWPFAIGALLFDLVVVGLLVRGVRLVLMRRRYGAPWLRFKRFPFHPGDRVEASVDAFGALGVLPSLNATLRCVQERYEVRGMGKNRATKVICYALWSSTITAERTRKGTFEVAFDLPADASSCALADRPARFWELELASADVPGVDYAAKFLVPVYARER
jgi:hypothetical protein